MKLGSHPVFEIALERCLTELGQNVLFLEYEHPEIGNTPSRTIKNGEFMLEQYRGTSIAYSINEEIIKNLVMEDEPYVKFLYDKDNPSNNDIYRYVISRIRKKKEPIFVNDSSLCSEIKTLKVIDMSLFHVKKFEENFNIFNLNINELFAIKNLFDALNVSIMNDYDFERFKDVFYDLIDKTLTPEYQEAERIFNSGVGLFTFTNELYKLPDFFKILNEIKDGKDSVYLRKIKNTKFKNDKLKYQNLNKYKQTHLYSFEEIKSIGKEKGFEYNDDDMSYSTNMDYLLEKIIYEPSWKYFHDDDYVNMIDAMTRKENN